MLWKGRQKSDNVEDRRGGGGGTARRVGGLGIFGTILVVLFAMLIGENPLQLLSQVQTSQPAQTTTRNSGSQIAGQGNDELGDFVSVVLKETEDVWNKVFREQLNQRYEEPTLVLFTQQVRSACGFASAASGPFYCPADKKLYIDLSFYRELRDRFDAPGDFAMAYVVAHEVAHHVQNLLGITRQVQSQKGRISEVEYNDLMVRLELQADFLAGVWAHHTHKKGLLEQGDVEEALKAAHEIGDDRLQMRSRGYVVPESFTHGTSEQRKRWLMKGMKTGDLSQGDTFAARKL